MEPLRWDEPGASVAAPEATGLPPGVILSAHYLEDVASFKGHGRLLARDGGILIGVVVEKGLNKQLRTMARQTKANIPLFSHEKLLNCWNTTSWQYVLRRWKNLFIPLSNCATFVGNMCSCYEQQSRICGPHPCRLPNLVCQ